MSGFIDSRILVDEYNIVRNLGEGTFASVVAATNVKTNEQVAIKQVYVQRAFLEDAQEQIKNLQILTNDHIVKVKDFFYDPQEFNLNIVLELCSGSLRDQINAQHVFSQSELISFMIQIVSAFLELEKKKIMHLDFKPENVLLADDEGKHYKVCDFGCSQMSQISRLSGYQSQVFGTFNYLAPEVYLNYKGKKNRSSADIWSFGVTLYQMIFRCLPFVKNKSDTLIDRAFAQNYFYDKGYKMDYIIEEDGPAKIVSFIKKMLKPNPIERINWVDLKKEMMNEFKIPEHLFMNIEEVVNNFIPISELFLRVIKMLKCDKTTRSDSQFLTINSKQMNRLREAILYYFYIIIQQFGYTFEAKFNCLGEQQAINASQLLGQVFKQREKCPQNIKTFEKNDLDFRETQLIGQLKKCINFFAKDKQQPQQIIFLTNFCKQLLFVIEKENSLFSHQKHFINSLKLMKRMKKA